MEPWRPIPGHEGRYEASSEGRIRSRDRVVETRSGALRTVQGLVLRPRTNPGGYLCVRLGRGAPIMVHQAVALAFLGPRLEGRYACHNDGDRANNCSRNLRYDTPKANQRDRIAHGTDLRGSRVPHAKLTEADVLAIRAAVASETHAAIAARYGIGRCTVTAVASRRSWRHV